MPSASGVAAVTAELEDPEGLAVDPMGNVLIADAGEHEVDLLAVGDDDLGYGFDPDSWSAGTLFLIAGGGEGTPLLGSIPADTAELGDPVDVTSTTSSEVLIADAGLGTIDALYLCPSPPTDLSQIGDGAFVELSWGAPSYGGGLGIDGYELVVTAEQSDEVVEQVVLSSSLTNFVVHGLVAGNSYDVAIAATNSLGEGDAASLDISVPTEQVAPSGPGAISLTGSTLTAASTGIHPRIRLASTRLVVARAVLLMTASCDTTDCAGSVEVTSVHARKERRSGTTFVVRETSVLARVQYEIVREGKDRLKVPLTSAGRKVLGGSRATNAQLIVTVRGGSTLRRTVSIGR